MKYYKTTFLGMVLAVVVSGCGEKTDTVDENEITAAPEVTETQETVSVSEEAEQEPEDEEPTEEEKEAAVRSEISDAFRDALKDFDQYDYQEEGKLISPDDIIYYGTAGVGGFRAGLTASENADGLFLNSGYAGSGEVTLLD